MWIKLISGVVGIFNTGLSWLRQRSEQNTGRKLLLGELYRQEYEKAKRALRIRTRPLPASDDELLDQIKSPPEE